MIEFRNARIPMGRDKRLHIADWRLAAGEFWVVIGEGGSGKSSLARAIAEFPGLSDTAAFISFDREKEIRAQIRRDDDSEWTGKPDEGRDVEGFIGGETGLRWLHDDLIRRLSGRGVRNLSTGEFRQVLIAREAGRGATVAVLDEPFEGLDVDARPRLTAQLKTLHRSGVLVVLTVNRREDIPDFTTGLALLAGDSLVTSGNPEDVLSHPAMPDEESEIDALAVDSLPIPPPPNEPEKGGDILLNLRNVSLSYQGRRVLDDVDWTVKAGESWLLTGPNGSGKTSLMNLISGDEPRGYGQNIQIFGREKGSGESTAWIKSRMGQVSAILQEAVSRHASAPEVIGSGLKDSLVLTESLDGVEQTLVAQWMEVLGLKGKEKIPFYRLPYGERRLAMIGRGMIKHPPLLLLDEPMHGLDEDSRAQVMHLVDSLIMNTGTSVLFVSHRAHDAPPSINRHIRLVPGANGGASRAEIGIRKP